MSSEVEDSSDDLEIGERGRLPTLLGVVPAEDCKWCPADDPLNCKAEEGGWLVFVILLLSCLNKPQLLIPVSLNMPLHNIILHTKPSTTRAYSRANTRAHHSKLGLQNHKKNLVTKLTATKTPDSYHSPECSYAATLAGR